MELTVAEQDLFGAYLGEFAGLTGDGALAPSWVRRIIGAESLCCSRIAAFSPVLAATPHGERRVRRLVHAETTKRSTLDADHLIGRLQARGVEQLRGEGAIWVLLDGSDLRKPHAQEMEALQRVKRLAGPGTVPGYRTLNAIGVGRARRGLLYHRLFSSAADGFLSESAETQAASPPSAAAALSPCSPPRSPTSWTRASTTSPSGRRGGGRGTTWSAGCSTATGWCARWPTSRSTWPTWRRGCSRWRASRPRWWCARGSRPVLGFQPVPAVVAAPLVVTYQEEVRTRPDGAQHERQVCWWRCGWRGRTRSSQAPHRPAGDERRGGDRNLPDVPATLEHRGRLQDRETMPRLGRRAGARARGGAHAGGARLGGGGLPVSPASRWRAEVRLLTRLGGGEWRANRPPGKLVLTRGLRPAGPPGDRGAPDRGDPPTRRAPTTPRRVARAPGQHLSYVRMSDLRSKSGCKCASASSNRIIASLGLS